MMVPILITENKGPGDKNNKNEGPDPKNKK